MSDLGSARVCSNCGNFMFEVGLVQLDETSVMVFECEACKHRDNVRVFSEDD